ncbi:OX-2 membrane glycoprotein isoform X2 [Tyto alba]|nr:OX-2 membrane glycoprotein isoform X2 [Tyto alba]XP_042644958.1 OX-2 membrane glycoprotein isoform X2 [Tyto alba]
MPSVAPQSSAPRFGKVKETFPSKMTFQALFLCLACAGLGKANVVPQAEQRSVKMGDNVTLSCALTEPKEVLQVTWQKDSGKSYNNIATYSIIKGLKIHEPYQDRMNFTSLVLNETSITFWDTRMDDSGCYTCLFNAFPSGSSSGRTCLSVFGLNASVHYNISEGHLIATCNAVGLPEPTITWDNLFNSTPTQETVRHANGIVSITSKLEVSNTESLSAQGLTCRVSNMNEKMELPVKVKGEKESSLHWLMIPVGILIVIILVLFTLCWRKRICRRS